MRMTIEERRRIAVAYGIAIQSVGQWSILALIANQRVRFTNAADITRAHASRNYLMVVRN